MNKWSKEFWLDLVERVLATFLGAALTAITVNGVENLTVEGVWAILGVPTLVSLIKGLLANLANPESGASLLPAPPGPEVNDEAGAVDPLYVLVCVVLVLVILAILSPAF